MESRKETLGLLLVDVTRRMQRAFQQQLEAQGRAVVYASLNEGVRPSPILRERIVQLSRAGGDASVQVVRIDG